MWTSGLRRNLSLVLRLLIGLVWFGNGLMAKVLGLVPRHEQIVATILGDAHAHELTVAIGLGEIALALWIWSGLWSRTSAMLQIALVGAMNVLELVLSPGLLFWGRSNVLFAALFAALVYYHGFVLTRAVEDRA